MQFLSSFHFTDAWETSTFVVLYISSLLTESSICFTVHSSVWSWSEPKWHFVIGLLCCHSLSITNTCSSIRCQSEHVAPGCLGSWEVDDRLCGCVIWPSSHMSWTLGEERGWAVNHLPSLKRRLLRDFNSSFLARVWWWTRSVLSTLCRCWVFTDIPPTSCDSCGQCLWTGQPRRWSLFLRMGIGVYVPSLDG